MTLISLCLFPNYIFTFKWTLFVRPEKKNSRVSGHPWKKKKRGSVGR